MHILPVANSSGSATIGRNMPNQLPNNDRAHSSRNSLSPPIPHGQRVTTLRGVWQDKAVLTNARAASTKPAPPEKETRARKLETNIFRSQKRSTTRAKLVHTTLWLHPLVKAELQRTAKREGLSVSTVGAAFLEKAIRQDVHSQYGALIEPIIEQAIAKHMRAYSNRLAVLLVRSLFASEQVRGLVTNILSHQDGVTQPVLEEILNGSSNAAKRNITRLTPQLAALVEEIKRWMDEEVKPND
jgi:hypothetical protein